MMKLVNNSSNHHRSLHPSQEPDMFYIKWKYHPSSVSRISKQNAIIFRCHIFRCIEKKNNYVVITVHSLQGYEIFAFSSFSCPSSRIYARNFVAKADLHCKGTFPIGPGLQFSNFYFIFFLFPSFSVFISCI